MDENLNSMLGTAICGDCVEIIKNLPENSINLIVTSPPYNVGINYDVYKDDELTMEEYLVWCSTWLKECYRVLDTDGRLAINIYHEIGLKNQGGRYMISAEFYRLALAAGFHWFGMADLHEQTPHRAKLTSFGSWMSSSGPYIYNPQECVLLFYKQDHIRKKTGISWKPVGEELVPDKKNPDKLKTKKIYNPDDKKEFMDIIFARWEYKSDKQQLTKACFSLDIPLKAIKILSYEDDIVLDPFGGSGTTGLAAEMLNRRWISIDLSPNYTQIANDRIQNYRLK